MCCYSSCLSGDSVLSSGFRHIYETTILNSHKGKKNHSNQNLKVDVSAIKLYKYESELT